MDQSRSWSEWRTERREHRLIRQDLARRIRKNVIIETKVSPLRRFIEILITIAFSALIVYLALVLVDDIVLWFTGHSPFWFVYRPVPIVGGVGIIAIVLLFVLLYLGSSLWLRFKHHWGENVTYDYPQFTTTADLAEYFELPIAEVERRQSAGKLVITENIENDRMRQLRARAKQIGLESDWGDD